MAQKGFIGERFEKKCQCGNIFFTIKSKKDKKYCSMQCKKKYSKGSRFGVVISNSYNAIHLWVKNNKEKPSGCQICGATNVKIQWANKSHEYKRELDDWLALCIPCHRKHDLDEFGRKRNDTQKFNLKKRESRGILLTEKEVVDIYTSKSFQKELSKKYNVDGATISRIKSGKSYNKFTKDLIVATVKPMYIKLTENQAKEIFMSNKSGIELATLYNVSQQTISSIRHGRRWNRVM